MKINIKEVPLGEIQLSPELQGIRHQVAYGKDDLDTLKKSLRSEGQFIPMLVTQSETGYQLIAGHRRWQALRFIEDETGQAETALVRVMEGEVNAKTRARYAAIENCQRRDLDGEERNRLIKLLDQNDYTKDQIAAIIGLSDKQVERLLKVLRDTRMTEFVSQGVIPMSTAERLVVAADDDAKKASLYGAIEAFKREAEQKIEEKVKKARQDEKELPAEAKRVSSYLERQTVTSWTAGLSHGKHLTTRGRWMYRFSHDEKTDTLRIEGTKLSLRSDPNRNLLLVAFKLQQILPILEKEVGRRLRGEDLSVEIYPDDEGFEPFCMSRGFKPAISEGQAPPAAVPAGPAPVSAEEVLKVQA